MAVIYEKHYPHPTLEEEMKELEEYMKEHESDPDYNPEQQKSFDEFNQEMIDNRSLVPLPEKIEKSDEFIRLAIETAELYELDTRISRHDSHIEVNYSFDDAGDMAFLIPVIRLADSISFFTGISGFDNTISLDYFTHAVYLGDELVHPLDLNS